MNKSIIFGALTSIFLLGTFGQAFAQYAGSVQSAPATLEETLALAKERVKIAAENPATGSGTPILSADGVVGASVISALVFGGIAGMLFYKGKSGKYAAQGRG